MSECLVTLIVGVAAGETHFFLAATRILKQDPHDWAREEKVNAVDKNFRGRYGGCSTADLKEINPGIPLEGMMLKLKLQYFGHLMQRVDSLEKTLMLGGIWGRRRRGRQRMRWLDGIMFNVVEDC